MGTTTQDRPKRVGHPGLRVERWRRRPVCCYCGARMARRRSRLDHVKPLSRGGSNAVSNLALVCAGCDAFKADRTPGQLLLWSIRVAAYAALARLRGLVEGGLQ